MSQKTVCDTKVLYDTEFEAEIACARHSDDMKPYRCPNTGHYHITHIRKEERLGAGHGHSICDTCKLIYRTAKKHACPSGV